MFGGKTRAYFLFTKKERRGIISLVILILILFFIPELFELIHKKPDREKIKRFDEEVSKWIAGKQTDSSEDDSEETEHSEINNKVIYPGAAHAKKESSLFYFDPNKISASDWKKLGMNDRVTKIILHYLSRGGRFKKAEDLKKIYGLKEEEYRRLFPYIKIEEPERVMKNKEKTDTTGKRTRSFSFSGFESKKKKDTILIDINLADTSELMSLRGIGNKLARRIVNYREKLGGFYSIDQIAETYALSDSVYREIEPRLKLGTESVKKIDINHATIDELKSHPYIHWNLARAIVEYRKQHGPFRSLDELNRLNIIGLEIYQKLIPYLTLDSL